MDRVYTEKTTLSNKNILTIFTGQNSLIIEGNYIKKFRLSH